MTNQLAKPNFIETDCTITHNGQAFTAGGAVVTQDYLIAYPDKAGQLKDWHGNVIGTYRVISQRKPIFFGHHSWIGDTYYFMRGIVQGREYALRGFGEGMIARGKALKAKP